MLVRNSFRFMLLAGVCLAPVALAFAADDTGFDLPDAAPAAQDAKPAADSGAEDLRNEATFGVRGQSRNSAAYGRYNGNSGGGVDGVFGLKIRERDPWNEGGTNYLQFTVRDLSVGTGELNISPETTAILKMGQQGTWGVNFNYDAMTFIQSDDFHALYNTNGTLNGNIPTLNQSGKTTTATYQTAYSSKEPSYTVGTRRDKGSIAGNYAFQEWLLTGGLTHEHKDGVMGQSSYVLGNTQSFLQPIDYDTDRFDTALAFSTPKLQAKIGYSLSSFTDNNTYMNLWNSGTNTAATSSIYGPSTIYTLPPSNMAHMVNGQLGYNYSPVTRLNANFNYGLQLQDDPFAQASGNTSLLQYLKVPRSSLQGMVQTFLTNLTLSTKPVQDVDVKMGYTLDARVVNTPGIYGMIGSRVESFNSAANVYTGSYTTRRAPLNPSWTKQVADVSASYKIVPSTKLTLGYTWRETERTDSLVRYNGENEVTGKVQTKFNSDLNGTLTLNHSNRTASAPDYTVWNQLWQIGADCQPNTAGVPACSQIPYNMAARIQDAAKARMTQNLGQDGTVGVVAKFANDTYPDVIYGRTRDYKIAFGPDLNFNFGPDTETHLFYNFERVFNTFNDTSRTNNGSSLGGNSTYYDWTEKGTQDTHTVGLGGTSRLSSDFKIGTDYLFSYGNLDIEQGGVISSSGAAITSQLPQFMSMLNSFKAFGEYEYVPGVTFHLGYTFDWMYSNDWAMVGPTSLSATLFSTQQKSPSYVVHTVLSRVAFKW